MKTFLLDNLPIYALVVVLAGVTAPYSVRAAGPTPGTGCMWNEARGSCMVANNEEKEIHCDVRVQVTTNRNQKTTKVNNLVIAPKSAYHTVEFHPSWDDKIEKAQIAAKCK